MEIYSIYDEAVQAFGIPMFFYTGVEIKRELQRFVNKEPKESIMQSYPQQFVLYKLGNWNHSIGKFDLLEQPLRLYSLDTLIELQEEHNILKEVE